MSSNQYQAIMRLILGGTCLLCLQSTSALANDVSLIFSHDHNLEGITLSAPREIELDSQDNLYAMDSRGGILKISSGGTPQQIVDPIEGRFGFDHFHSQLLQVDSQQQIYIGGSFRIDNIYREGVIRITPNGIVDIVLDSAVDEFINHGWQIDDMVIDGEDNLIVLLSERIVVKLSPNGVLSQIMNGYEGSVRDEAGFGNGFEGKHIAVDQDNNVVIAGILIETVGDSLPRSSLRIVKILHDSAIMELAAFNPDERDVGFFPSEHIVSNNSGQIFGVTSTNNGPTATGIRWTPPGIAQEVINVSGDGTGSSVSTFHSNYGHPFYTFENSGNPLVGPSETASDVFGNFYVTGQDSHNAFIIFSDGAVSEIIDANGDSLGNQLESPRDIAVDSTGQIYVLGLDNIFSIGSLIGDMDVPSSTDHPIGGSDPDYSATFSYGTDSAETLLGGSGTDLLFSLGGDDRLQGSGGYDFLYGGEGHDTAIYQFDELDYALSRDPLTGDTEVIFKSGESLGLVSSDIESLEFRDSTVTSQNLSYWGTYSVVPSSAVDPVFRFYNTRDRAFFYTSNAEEAQIILDRSSVARENNDEWPYVLQGATFGEAKSYTGAVPLHRFYNYVTGHHFLTASIEERNIVLSQVEQRGWPFLYEGAAFNVYPSDPNPGFEGLEVPVYRLFSPSLNRHFYTASIEERNRIMLTENWHNEGVGFYAERLGY